MLYRVCVEPEPAIVTFVWGDDELNLAVLYDSERHHTCDSSSAEVLYLHHMKRGKPGEFGRWWPRSARRGG